MSSIVHADGAIPPRRAPDAAAERSVGRVNGIVPLLLSLNFATGLPPDMLRFPPNVASPTVHPDTDAIVSATDLAAILEWPTQDIGRGRVMLGEVDERLDGFVVSLEAFRVIDVGGALVTVSIIRPDRTAPAVRTSADLWRLVREASVRYGGGCADPGQIGDDALLVVYRRVAQLAWLTGDRLATVTATRLDGDRERMIQAVRSIAALADDRIALRKRSIAASRPSSFLGPTRRRAGDSL